jgi:5-methylcytosine-specific restriction protein A
MTKLPDSKGLAAFLTDRFGLALHVSGGEGPDGAFVDIRSSDLHDNEGFVIHAVVGWRSVVAQLRIGTFASDLLSDIARASQEKKAQFAAIASALSGQGAKVRIRVNGTALDPLSPSSWPGTWGSLEFELERTPIMFDHENEVEVRDVILSWAGGLLGMLVCLLPLEDILPEEQLDTTGLPEGAKERIEVNRYERSRVNRAVCISVHGPTCAVCGFDFGAVYGALGRDFIHVHHKVPVSVLGAGYLINPVTDLVPVCPNCHAMLHRHDPPLDIEDLKIVLASHGRDGPLQKP